MALSYSTALEILDTVAIDQRASSQNETRTHVSLGDAIGSVLDCDLVSSESTPAHDTSAMDGYAIHSAATANASPESSVRFRVRGRITAGDDPRHSVSEEEDSPETELDNVQWCVEIMTGAIFPDGFDACVKYEDTVPVNGKLPQPEILVSRPIAFQANKRLAGNDVKKGEIVLRAGKTIQASHLLPLASLGFLTIPVATRPRVCVFSTGKELLPQSYGLARDTNGPYITAALEEFGAQVDFGGILDDDAALLQDRVEEVSSSNAYDMIITTGAVSKGCFDHIPSVLAKVNAEILFHGLAIRPGHPVLFALLPSKQADGGEKRRRTAFFGLPGNPGASAACFRFLVVPYLRGLRGQARESPIIANLEAPIFQPGNDATLCKKNLGALQETGPDIFRHGVLRVTAKGSIVVTESKEQSPAKLSQFATANCWIHLRPGGQSKLEPGRVECYPMSTAFALPAFHVAGSQGRD